MPTLNELDDIYMGTAMIHAGLSKAIRAKVGAVLVTTNGVMLTGYNGCHAGGSNECEVDNVTKPEVIHAELNAVLKAAKEGVSCKDSTIYVTHYPCKACSSMLIQVGIKRLVYLQQYGEPHDVLTSFVDVSQLK